VICIAGMPRSGTSLAAQLLHRCGVEIGPADQLMPPSSNNSDGFWENLRFVDLNERLLRASGATWFAPPRTLRPAPALAKEAAAIIAQFDGKEPWLWKDPRNAITLPFWKALLPPMKVVLCIRHPAETAASLVASSLIPPMRSFYWRITRADSLIRLREGEARLDRRLMGIVHTSISQEKRRAVIYEAGLQLWRIYNTRALEETNPADRIVTHYEDVLANPRDELARILDFAGVRVSPDVLAEAVRAVSPVLRHQHAGAAQLDPGVEALYAGLLREARAPRTSANISA